MWISLNTFVNLKIGNISGRITYCIYLWEFLQVLILVKKKKKIHRYIYLTMDLSGNVHFLWHLLCHLINPAPAVCQPLFSGLATGLRETGKAGTIVLLLHIEAVDKEQAQWVR